MEHKAKRLADYLAQRLRSTPVTSRLIVGLAGVPASGKSTLARSIVDYLNETFVSELPETTFSGDGAEDVAVLIGLDGWHLMRAQLDAFPDPKLAHDRRGAHWTFDGRGYVEFVRALRQPHPAANDPQAGSASAVIHAPSFDHALKDPTFDAVPVYPHHRLVVIEGLYPFLNVPPWDEAAKMLDERWWLDVSEEEAESRLVARHVKSGVAQDFEEAIWRSRGNDAPNGRFVRENISEPTLTIKSIQDPVFAKDAQ